MKQRREVRKTKDVFFKAGLGVTVFGVTFFAALFSSSHFMPITESSAETVGSYYANITNTGAVDIDLVATPDGYGKVGKDSLSVSTNANTGYKLYISTISTAPNNSLYLSTDSSTGITATTGSVSTPSKLAPNTWGYAPSRTTPSDDPASYTDVAADSANGDEVFIGVPEYGDENIIYTNNDPAAAGSNSIDVYYGVNASTALPSGEYSNAVVYTAIVEGVDPSSDEITISPTSQNGLSAGTEVTITTDLYPGFAASNLGNITVTIGGAACTNVAGTVGENGNLVITCDTPVASTTGAKDVVVTVEKYNKSYTLTGGFEYKGLPAFYTITTMQEMTSAVCNSVPTPSTAATTSMTVANYDPSLLVANGSYVAEASLRDIRDDNYYTVRKLADGNCWMTEDLALRGNTQLHPSDTDITRDWYLPVFSNELGIYRNIITQPAQDPSTHKGMYYSWEAATANSWVTSPSPASQADESICPKNWMMPNRYGNSSFINLLDTYAIKALEGTPAIIDRVAANPLSFSYLGGKYVNNTSSATDGYFVGVGDFGHWHVKQVNLDDARGKYTLLINASPSYNYSGDADPHAYQCYGVRCIAR